jgi:hypothetical protein
MSFLLDKQERSPFTSPLKRKLLIKFPEKASSYHTLTGNRLTGALGAGKIKEEVKKQVHIIQNEKGGKDDPSIFQQDSTCIDGVVCRTVRYDGDDGVFRHASSGARLRREAYS